jgi:hypothetical protein
MARNAGDRSRGVAGSIAKKIQAELGILVFLCSNVLWIVWGLHDRAYALIFLQLCLGFLNVRGAAKNRTS